MKSAFSKRSLITAALLLAASTTGRAMMALPQDVPVDRLVRNVEARLAKNPKDAEAFYTLGRIHFVAAAQKTGTIGVFGNSKDGLPRVADDDLQGGRYRRRPIADPNAPAPRPPTAEEINGHIKSAVENLRKAIALDPGKALYHHTLASVLEATPGETARALGGLPPGEPPSEADSSTEAETLIAQWGDASAQARDRATKGLRELGTSALPALMKDRPGALPEVEGRILQVIQFLWNESAITEYAAAFERSAAEDGKLRNQPLFGLGRLISYEAATHYLALTGQRPRSQAESAMAEKMTAHLKRLSDLPPSQIITPIILAPSESAPLASLLAPEKQVAFDLDGWGGGWNWGWVAPTTPILVWDPRHTGQIASGRQLFGSVTFGLFWRDGYAALDSLDDDHDGRLAGAELAGLALWTDRNSNGVSDPGEVTPIEQTAITSIALQQTATVGGFPANRQGYQLRSGERLATYDWISRGTGMSAKVR